ncbi:EFR1 family ferrodoxin [Clostridium felsineum]|uniref:EFR1 family ferrodoxin n=1 Tax=Clostridium felsineum TaxID=36839 RepID=UPI00098CD581|nr:EFR1 family ferrodoxin [Clostridium felsineum]URZ16652.1 Ion-translocating oxidoreductase complex subunit B [Clostridium felsineum DSM 794]
MVFYFTATGNCLYVAKQFDTNLISIPQVINNDNLNFEDETIGIVCPIYCGMPPQFVIDFMKKAKFKADYFYMIMTYGKDHTVAGEYTKKISELCGIKIDYIGAVLMVDNYLPAFDMNEEKAIDKKVDEQVTAAVADVAARKHKIVAADDEGRNLYAMVMKRNKEMPSFNNGEQIKVTDACIGCGICSKVCPIGNFYIENGKVARRSNTCTFCLACAQNCPHKAITLSIMDKNSDARYRNEHISLQEIIEANNQNE